VVDKNNCVNSEVLAEYIINYVTTTTTTTTKSKENFSRGVKKGTHRLYVLFYYCEMRPNSNSTAPLIVSPWKVKKKKKKGNWKVSAPVMA